jgi:hypothetical protein
MIYAEYYGMNATWQSVNKAAEKWFHIFSSVILVETEILEVRCQIMEGVKVLHNC